MVSTTYCPLVGDSNDEPQGGTQGPFGADMLPPAEAGGGGHEAAGTHNATSMGPSSAWRANPSGPTSSTSLADAVVNARASIAMKQAKRAWHMIL